MKRAGFVFVLALVLLSLGCGSSQTGTREIVGTVDEVNVRDRFIELVDITTGRDGETTARVYYDEDTRVSYEGKTYRPENLERGDQIALTVRESGRRTVADSIAVRRNVRAAMEAEVSRDPWANATRGTVRSIDRMTKKVEMDIGGLTTYIFRFTYDDKTTVDRKGQRVSIDQLQVGDEIDVNTRLSGDVRIAEAINIAYSANETRTPVTASRVASDLRGTVRSVVRGSIQLTDVSFGNRPGGSAPRDVSVSYDNATRFEYRGRPAAITGLERGDVVDVRLRTPTEPFVADEIWLVQDVRSTVIR